MDALQSIATVINMLELGYGRLAAEGQERNYKKVITLDELITVETMFVDRVKEVLKTSSLFDFSEWRMVYHLLDSFDPEYTKSYLDSALIQDENVLWFLGHFVNVWTGTGKEYEIQKGYTDYFSTERVLNAIESCRKNGTFFRFPEELQHKCAAFSLAHSGSPDYSGGAYQDDIKTVRELQTVLSDVRTVEDAMRAYDRFFVDNGYLEKVQGWGSGIHYRATKKGQDNPVITNKLSNTMLIRSAEYFERNFTQKAKKEQFCVSKEQKIPKGYAIHFNDGKHTYSKNEDWKPGTYYVTKGYSILRTNFETKEAALKWVQELAKGRNKNGRLRFVPPQLAHVKRTGPDYRNGVEITGQHYLDTFGFRGGEFGNWMNQNDRQTSLNMGFEALKDLASALKISDKDIAYQGTLAIAFGARGSGNAAAHYEPLRTVINLTKMHGAGSLAHEWWHGLDDYLGTKMGAKGMLSEQPRLYAPFQKLIDTMKYKPETPEQAAKRTEAQTERTRKNAAGWLDSSVLASLKRYGNEEQMETYAVLREAFLSGEPGSVEQISAFKKNVTGRVIPKSERERLEIFERMLFGMQAQEAPQIGRTETDFYRNSVRMGKECEKDGGYWDSNVEMTARAFACYIKDKLPYISDYLAGHADCALTLVSGKGGEMEVLKAFPVGEERRAINAVFDEIIQDLKREQLLTHADVTLPLSVSELREAADGQLSMFGVGRPSVMDQLAANRPADKKSPAQTVSRKNHEPEI